MGLKPKPTPLDRELFIEEVDAHRLEDCDHYGECLVGMATQGGKKRISWTCRKCPLFDRGSGGRYPRRP